MPREQWYRRHKDSIKFWTFTVILTLKTTIWFLYNALQLIILYHPIKSGYKNISVSADRVETVIFNQMSPPCDPELEDQQTNLLAELHDTLAHDVASPYQVWLQVIPQLRKYCPGEHSLKFWNFSVTLTWTTTEQSNLSTRQSTLWWCTIKPSLLAKGSTVQIIY